MAVKMFWKEDCGRCPATKDVMRSLEALGASVEYINVDNDDGLFEANMYAVMATPTTLVLDKDDDEVAAWRGNTPELDALQDALKSL